MGLASLGWAGVCLNYLVPPMPVVLYPWLHLLRIAGVAVLTGCPWLFFAQESGTLHRRFARLCTAWTVLGPRAVAAVELPRGVPGDRPGRAGRWPVGRPALHLRIVDNGRGFDTAAVRRGKGLAGLDKRARALGASLSLQSGADGTLLEIRLPR